MSRLTRAMSFLLLVGTTAAGADEKSASIKTPWKKWYFAFTTPEALPAKVTLLKLLDVEGYASAYRAIDQPRGTSTGTWSERNSAGSTQFNRADRLPQIMMFCWDSLIDQKVYQTTLFFTPET